MKTLKVDGIEEMVWKVEPQIAKTPTPVPRVPGLLRPTGTGGKSVSMLRITRWRSFKLFFSERSLTYTADKFLPPEELVAIDTRRQCLHMASGVGVRATISIARLSKLERALVENARSRAEQEKLAEEVTGLHREVKAVRKASAEAGARSRPDRHATYLFAKAGDSWDIIFNKGAKFHVADTLGVKYLDYLLHHPNQVLPAYELEIAIRADKASARSRDSVQETSDAKAMKKYREQLKEIQKERTEAEFHNDPARVEKLDQEVSTIKSNLRREKCAPSNDDRARDNVRKAITAVIKKLQKRGRPEKEFAEHLKQFVNLGYECIYNQPEGRVWT